MGFAQSLVVMMVLAFGPGGGMFGSEQISVRYGPGEEKLARAVYQAAAMGDKRVVEELKIPSPGKVMILLAPGGKSGFQATQPNEAAVPEWAIGTAYPQGRTIVISHPDNMDFRYEDLEHVVIHEYTHIAVGVYLGDNRTPHWLDEGLAQVEARERTFSTSMTIGLAALTGRVIPFERLSDSWPQSRGDADLAYAESVDFVMWIKSKFGQDALGAILKKYREIGVMDTALISATGYPLRDLQGMWRDKVVRKYRWISVLSGGVSLWFIASILLIIGYLRKRRQGKLKIKMWEIEDELRWQTRINPMDDDDDDDDLVEDDDTPPPSLH